MKKVSTTKRLLAAALLLLAGTVQSLANEDNIIWVKAEAYPTGAGTVYTDWSSDGDKTFDTTSEFKRYSNGAISTAFVWNQPAEGWLFAGYARDNGNHTYDVGLDRQVKVEANGFFTAVYDPTVYSGSSTSEADQKAAAALETMEAPSDHIFAVFTQGAVARVAPDELNHGHAYANKLSSVPGDQITISAWGDSESLESGTKYYKFAYWSDAEGNKLSEDRVYTITVKGMDIYYAHFTETTKEEYQKTENDPHKSEHYYDSSAIEGDVNSDSTVDVADISAILTVMTDDLTQFTKEQADVNQDGNVDVSDISTVLTIMTKK